jgi:hypothetical protein
MMDDDEKETTMKDALERARRYITQLQRWID